MKLTQGLKLVPCTDVGLRVESSPYCYIWPQDLKFDPRVEASPYCYIWPRGLKFDISDEVGISLVELRLVPRDFAPRAGVDYLG
jgi:hypothetical protein